MAHYFRKYSQLIGIAFLLVLSLPSLRAQPDAGRPLWHGIERTIHYRPDAEDFILVNGKKRFNRALYGTNTGFRAEAGDLPEFALYMPGMGGNLKIGLIEGTESKWIIAADSIRTRYRPGSMIYEIRDKLLGNRMLQLTVLALAEGEGLIIQANLSKPAPNLQLVLAFGGATGKNFSRNGDIGADPESVFYLQPEYCRGNVYNLNKNSFQLKYGKEKQLQGVFPEETALRLADAKQLVSPLVLLSSGISETPVVTAKLTLKQSRDKYFLVRNPDAKQFRYQDLPALFTKAGEARKTLAQRVKLNTPDAWINTLGGALAVAADGIWEDPTYLHGAVAWRMRLNAWRGAYVADQLGWHDRARKHFSSYAASQVTVPQYGPVVADTALHIARQLEKMGTTVFSSGYISRNPNDNTKPHHYDMNLVFFDQMLTHFYWTGDLAFIREMWPVIKRHLAWEKRNFDQDGDGLYDAYAAIWASDALQYSGGGVTHSSSYNYRSNRIAAQLAKVIGEDPTPYQEEADKILKAVNSSLWMKNNGWYAEYKDLLGLRQLHPSAGLWTIYHAIDSDVPDAFQAYQSLRYIDTQIPHIPVRAKGLPANDYYMLSTTNWQPYDWSLNNVALAEVLHTALAYWQGGRAEEAFKLWQSSIIESMYLSSSPGGFQQLSFYDAVRGELYRDFADPIGVASRTLVEGLFGILPNALSDTLTIRPGLPAAWEYASLSVPDISFDLHRSGDKDVYTIIPSFSGSMNLRLILKGRKESVRSVTVNGNKTMFKIVESSVGYPSLEISASKAREYKIEIQWGGAEPEKILPGIRITNAPFNFGFKNARILELFDPQDALKSEKIVNNSLQAVTKSTPGNKTVFAKLRQGDFTWWAAIDFELMNAVSILAEQEQEGDGLSLTLRNSSSEQEGTLIINKGKMAYRQKVRLAANASSEIRVPASFVNRGTNLIRFEYKDGAAEQTIVNWSAREDAGVKWEKIDLSGLYNDSVTAIFRNKYLSPRPSSPTLQLPWQGIGNWCYPLTEARIDDAGLRKAAGNKNEIVMPDGPALSTPGSSGLRNIAFTSQWDNYPDSIVLPLKGKSSHAFFMLAGSTNPMQTRLDNAELLVYYKDGTSERLALRNPETWWPIEQDYFTDGFAFTTGAPKPWRVYLKTGQISRTFRSFTSIKGYSNFAIDGGAATILDLPLDPDKELKELKLKTLANDVVAGLMSVTLKRN